MTQCVLTSSVPALYCVAFAGDLYSLPFFRKSLLFALAPSFMFCLSLLIRYAVMSDYIDALEFFSGESIFMAVLSSLVFAVWALLLILVSRVIYKFAGRREIKNVENQLAPLVSRRHNPSAL